jgi:protoporphyrin/coproporphyrin ferrochelatase
MLFGFGGPRSPDEVRAFLDRVLAGRPVSRERYEEVVRHYEMLGGRSPYNELTMRQASGLRKALSNAGAAAKVVVAFRHSPPYPAEVLGQLKHEGPRRVLAFILAAHRSEASWNRYTGDVTTVCARLGGQALEIEYPAPWHANDRFIEAVSERTISALARLSDHDRRRVELIFTAHSIPASMASRSAYVGELHESARLVARTVGSDRWSIAFQSSGSREGWLGPDICEALKERAGGCVVLIPIGFLCDHIEVLYDLDIEAATWAREADVRMERAGTVGDHPAFIQMMAAIALAHLRP